ncbi:MAG: PAS domain S-box protein [Myxococcales bacterium]|nr:PAS domain S-box protein [Myxococcales bacterium]
MTDAPDSPSPSPPIGLVGSKPEALYQAVLEMAVDGIITIDGKGVILSFNHAAERIFGYDSNDIIGQKVNVLMPEPYRSQHDNYIRRYRVTREPRIIGIGREVIGRRRDGSTFPMDLAVSQVNLPDHVIYTSIVRDLTERRRVETLAEVGRIASGLAHEIGTPMNIILGYAERLRARLDAAAPSGTDPAASLANLERTTKRVGEGLTVIIEQVERVSRLMDSLLSYARRPPLQRRPIELSTVVKSVMAILGERLRDQNVRADVDFSETTPSLEADKDRLEQVVLNLAINAIDAMPGGGVLGIEVRGLKEPPRVELVVSDTGTGIPTEQLPHIFEPFVTTKPTGKGTGLGLSVVRSIIREHGGSIAVHSEVGQGTRFVLELPAREQASPI